MSEENTNIEEEDVPVNPLELSDEEIMNMPPPEDPVEDPVDEDTDEEDTEEETTEEDDEEEESTTEDEVDETNVEDTQQKPEPVKAEKEDLSEETDSTEKSEEASSINFEEEYNKLLAPFKASGKEMSVNNTDEALRLMKMGVDYHNKMHGLKPNLKLLKMLDNNGLLDEGKLSYLIDLDKKNPEAIAKLLKDSEIDPLDVDVNTETEYQPNAYTVSDKEVELDQVLEKIQDSDTFPNTIDVISNKWDESSKKVLLEQPAIIEIINDHMASGIYDQIQGVIAKKELLGELTGLSNLEAYKQVGDELQAVGAFATQQQTPPPVNVDSTPSANVADPKLKDRKRAASSTKSAPIKKAKQKFNPLALSDEEFEKISAPL